jgi:CubicO group peptidase (beta-lactamase class C family)
VRHSIVMRTVSVCLTSALFVLGAAPSGQSGRDSRSTALSVTRMDTYFDRLARFGASGAVVIAQSGRAVYRRGFGWADRAGGVPMSPAMGVDIASMAKDMTVVAVLQLEERGLLDLRDSLGSLLDSVPPDKGAITIEQLLTHRSGLPSFFVDGDDFTSLSRTAALHAILGATLLFTPGQGSEYSDAGFVLLATIIERLTGETIEAFVDREQIQRAGLTGTQAYGSARLRERGDLAHGYVGSKDAGTPAGYVKSTDYWVVKGAGGVVSTVDDIVAWESALRTGRLLSTRGLDRLLALPPDSSEYGSMGALERLRSGRRGWVRRGAQDFGFAAGAIRYQEDTTVIAVAVNRQPVGMDVSRVRNGLLTDVDAFLFGTPPDLPPEGRAITEVAASAVGSFVLADGSTLRIQRDGDRLLATPDGPLAVDLLAYPADTAGRRYRLNLALRTESILRKLCGGDPAPLREAMDRPSERVEAVLSKAACADSSTRIRAIGSVPRWGTEPPSAAPATLVEFTSGGRVRVMRFEWEGDRISAVGGGAIEVPTTVFLAASDERDFVGYNLGIRAPVYVSLESRTGQKPMLRIGPDSAIATSKGDAGR